MAAAMFVVAHMDEAVDNQKEEARVQASIHDAVLTGCVTIEQAWQTVFQYCLVLHSTHSCDDD